MTSHMGSHVGGPLWESHMGSPTDGRTDGRTYEESFSPTRDNPSSSVTHTRAYEIVLCPICSKPVTKLSHDRPNGLAKYCSKPCRHQGIARTQRANHALVDDVAVFRLIEGWVVDSTRSERIEAVRQLTCQGRSIAWIADYLRTTTRSVERYRHEIQNRKRAA